MPELILSIDTSEVREGKLEDLKTAMKELVEFVDANEPRPLAYDVYLDETGTRMTVFQIHPDSASMEFHMEAAGGIFPRLKDLLTLSTMEVYGQPSDQLLERIRQKARMLGNVPVTVHELHAGFTRFGR